MKLTILLTNPFLRYSENKLFLFGLFTFLCGSLIAFYLGMSFDGLLDVHSSQNTTLLSVFRENCINVVIIATLLFVLGLLVNKKTRVIDIVNSVLLFRIPFYFMCLLVSFPFMKTLEIEVKKNINHLDKLSINPTELIGVFIISILMLLLLIYAVWILFQGFKTATNAKKPLHYFAFAFIIVLSEITTKYIIYHF